MGTQGEPPSSLESKRTPLHRGGLQEGLIRRAMGSHACFYEFGDDLSRLEERGQSQGVARGPLGRSG